MVLEKTRWKARTLATSPRLPFEVRCRLLYWQKRRSWPNRRPVTYNQKILWKMIKDRRAILTVFADKVAVRDYVARVVGPEVLTELYAVVEDPQELDPDRFPSEFVVKPNHASELIWIVADRSRFECDGSPLSKPGLITTTREELRWDRLVATCREWLAINYSDRALEWAYRDIAPRIMVEELLVDPGGHIPTDYKFFVFDGRVCLIEVHTSRFGDHRCNLLSPDWSAVDAQLTYRPADHDPPRPESLGEMIRIAESLGRETDFVRVDLYDVGGRVIFGELTSYPSAASDVFSPASFDTTLGSNWTVPEHYR